MAISILLRSLEFTAISASVSPIRKYALMFFSSRDTARSASA